jgi:hypothetical protein
MADSALGTKHTCTQCGTKFYDLNKVPAVCPKCHTEQKKPKPYSFLSGDGEHAVMVDDETKLDLSAFNDDADIDNDSLPKNMDTMESFEDDDEEIGSLSELEDRKIHEQEVGHDDTPDEEEMIESMKDGGLLVDDIDDSQ